MMKDKNAVRGAVVNVLRPREKLRFDNHDSNTMQTLWEGKLRVFVHVATSPPL